MTLDTATENYIAAILETEEYKTYQAELEKVKQYPELKAQIDEFRRQNYAFQNSADCDFKKLDQFEREYESFRENPVVDSFLAAELGLCRLIQEQSIRVATALQFE